MRTSARVAVVAVAVLAGIAVVAPAAQAIKDTAQTGEERTSTSSRVNWLEVTDYQALTKAQQAELARVWLLQQLQIFPDTDLLPPGSINLSAESQEMLSAQLKKRVSRLSDSLLMILLQRDVSPEVQKIAIAEQNKRIQRQLFILPDDTVRMVAEQSSRPEVRAMATAECHRRSLH